MYGALVSELSFIYTVLKFDFIVSMILPQVHLRKPCYDFSFLEMFRFK